MKLITAYKVAAILSVAGCLPVEAHLRRTRGVRAPSSTQLDTISARGLKASKGVFTEDTVYAVSEAGDPLYVVDEGLAAEEAKGDKDKNKGRKDEGEEEIATVEEVEDVVAEDRSDGNSTSGNSTSGNSTNGNSTRYADGGEEIDIGVMPEEAPAITLEDLEANVTELEIEVDTLKTLTENVAELEYQLGLALQSVAGHEQAIKALTVAVFGPESVDVYAAQVDGVDSEVLKSSP